MNQQDELRELIGQAVEHLRYCRELGLTHIGGQTPAAPIEIPAPVQAATKAATESTDNTPATPRAVEKPAIPVVTQPTPKPEIVMPRSTEKKPDQPAPSSLFGDAAAPPEDQYAGETLEDIRADLGVCQRCKLWETRANLVFGEGNPKAELMFVGEAPGADEDATGRPFVGRAGQLLTKMIEAIGLRREDVYIANILKSRPPGNRNPEADEIAACKPFLLRQIAVIRPKLIVTLGNPATQGLLETKTGITRIRGEFQDYPRLSGVRVLPTFHPAYLLRSPDKKREAWEDLKKVRAFLRGE
ncbi:MAG TPA: uracil-DNA glycosylase family protein [Blastocatellia bacterium]|nr:uracil-DNA glycosylase family protein [Blastocatellia bacterium]